jgi:hypothetical protein
MLVQSIRFVSPLEHVTDIENDNIDVFVELEDGHEYVIVVGTCNNILSLMDKEKMNFSEPGGSFYHC